MEDEDRDPIAALDRLDGGRAGVSGGGADDRDACVVLLQHVVVEPSEHLQRDILERERRPVEQLEQPVVRPELCERRHRGVLEPGIRRADDRAQLRGLDGVAGETGDDRVSDLGVVAAAKRGQFVPGEGRPPLRDVEAAIRSESREKHTLEIEDRRAGRGC